MATTKRARALVSILLHGVAAGQVLEASPEVIKALADAGEADPHKDAVAAAIAAGQPVVRSRLELEAEAAEAAANKVRVRIAELEDLLAKATDDATKAALQADLDEQRAALAA